jgi:hypothetical protein
VVIPANFGAQSDWIQNVLNAGGCRVRELEGFRQMGAPRLLSISEARPYLPLWFYIGLRYVVGTKHCLLLFDADASGRSDSACDPTQPRLRPAG